jgi:hypothetical protein
VARLYRFSSSTTMGLSPSVNLIPSHQVNPSHPHPETTKLRRVVDAPLVVLKCDGGVVTSTEKNVTEASLVGEGNQAMKGEGGKRILFWNERLEARRLRKSRSAVNGVSSKIKLGFFERLSDTTKIRKLKKKRRRV